MKKRVIISIVITLISIIITNNYWLEKQPVDFSLKAEGNGPATFEFVLNTKNNNEFKKNKYARIDVNLDKDTHIFAQAKRIRIAKRLKLDITTTDKKILLSDIKICQGKYKLNLQSFTPINATVKIKNNKLILTPKSEKFSLIYKEQVNIKSPNILDFKILCIITIISFLLSYKITSYLADFKVKDSHSRADIVFLTIFFLLLYLPLIKFDNENYSPKELRKLTKYKPLIEDKKVNLDWGINLNNYISDHFFLRNEIIKTYDKFKYVIAYSNYVLPNHALLIKKTNWAFRLDSGTVQVHNEFTKKEIDSIINNLKKLNDFCNKHNIKLYIVVVPSKENIYQKHNPYIKKNATEGFENVYKKIKKEKDLKIIYPIEEFKKLSNKELLFFKTDHHWTNYGAFIGYNLLADKIKQDFPEFQKESLKDFDITTSKLVQSDFWREFDAGQTLHSLLNLNNKSIAQKVLDVEYKYFIHKKKDLLKVNIDNIYLTKDFYFQSVNNLNAIEIGNSMSENLNVFLPYSFKHLKYIRINNGYRKFEDQLKIANYEDEIIRNKPDILILTLNTTIIKNIQHMYPNEENK